LGTGKHRTHQACCWWSYPPPVKNCASTQFFCQVSTYLTISASSCAIREYVVSFFEAQVLPDNFCALVVVVVSYTWSHSLKHKCCLTIFASSCAISDLHVVSFFEAQVLPHDFCLLRVPSASTWSRSLNTASRFLPLRVPSGRSTRFCSLKRKCCLTISASSCAISGMYVVSSFEGQVLPHDFRLFVCHQWHVRGLVL